MKKLIYAVLALLLCTTALAQEIDLNTMSTDELKALIYKAECVIASRRTGFPTLDEYIELHNAAMQGIGLLDNTALICRGHVLVQEGEVNDTFMYSLYDDPDSFAMVIVEKGTENILGAVACLAHTGYEFKQPAYLFDYVSSLAYGTGFLSDLGNWNDSIRLAKDLGLYETNAFEFGNTSTVLNESGNMKFSYVCDEELGLWFSVSEV